MGSGAWKSAEWVLENVPSKDASDAEWESFAVKAVDFCERYRGKLEYDMVCRNVKARCDAVFEGVPIIQKEPVELSEGFRHGKKKERV